MELQAKKIKDMARQLETLEEHREVLEKSRDAIFIRKQKPDNFVAQIRDGLSGETNQIGEFIDEFHRDGRKRNASVELHGMNAADAQQSSDEELFSNKQDYDNDEENKGNMDAMGPNGFPQQGAVSIYYYAGIIKKNELHQFQKLLYRASKGKVLCKIEHSDNLVNKSVYVLVF